MISRLQCFLVVLTVALILSQTQAAHAQLTSYSFTGTASITPTGGQTFAGTYSPDPAIPSYSMFANITVKGTYKFKGTGIPSTTIPINIRTNTPAYQEDMNTSSQVPPAMKGIWIRQVTPKLNVHGNSGTVDASFNDRGVWEGQGGDVNAQATDKFGGSTYIHQGISTRYNAVVGAYSIMSGATSLTVTVTPASVHNIFSVVKP